MRKRQFPQRTLTENEIENIITETQGRILVEHNCPATNKDLSKALSGKIAVGEEKYCECGYVVEKITCNKCNKEIPIKPKEQPYSCKKPKEQPKKEIGRLDTCVWVDSEHWKKLLDKTNEIIDTVNDMQKGRE